MDASASRRLTDNLTFSSTLLDEIYRSIDQQSQSHSTVTTRKKQSKCVEHDSGKLTPRCFNDDEPRASYYQKRIHNKVYEKPLIERSSKSSLIRERDSYCFSSSPKPKPKPKPKHDEFNKREKDRTVYGHHDGNLMNTKSKAMKIYNDLKKMKQPISPGGRLSSFFNSLFTTNNNNNNNNKPKTGDRTVAAMSRLNRKTKSVNECTCIGDTTSCRGKFSNDMRRSVKYYPVSVIVDKETDSSSYEINKNIRISEAARSLLKDYRKKVECELDSVTNIEDEDEDEDEFNDGRSDSSSDLFELNNLSPIRIRDHQEELPLYGTTRLHTNRTPFM